MPQLTVVVEPRCVDGVRVGQHQRVVGPRCHVHHIQTDHKLHTRGLVSLRKVPESQLPLCILPPRPQLALVCEYHNVECASCKRQHCLILQKLHKLRHVSYELAVWPRKVLFLEVCDAKLSKSLDPHEKTSPSSVNTYVASSAAATATTSGCAPTHTMSWGFTQCMSSSFQ
eukprot:CAMPEP_0206212914 /NCGR_PEP_ID=MMETSP0047_2-20121206/836_1 /ASSEMBLY_ACC=CAM_ASM_000192 /TAXON_ID=195065 /ORGANISM="Chroomonas mesostigmatica_cf, Strain CCMP1168" /LENGTH=170 /DNA_ID=CAMNT_0053635015 /DNA_START=531 /DNA_END=1044 /DNA_ORIENTATION=+